MAVTTVIEKVFVIGDRKEVVFTVEFDAAYVTAGEPFDPLVELGLDDVSYVSDGIAVNTAGTLSVDVHYDPVNRKLLAYETGAAVDGPNKEVSSAQSLATFKARLVAVGKGNAANRG